MGKIDVVVCDVFPVVIPFLLLDCGTLKRYPQAEVEINCPTYRVPIPFFPAKCPLRIDRMKAVHIRYITFKETDENL